MDINGLDLGDWSLGSIIGGLLFSTFGIYFIKRARKDGNGHQLWIGLVLLVYPYLIANVYLVWLLGTVLLFLGFYFRST